MESYLQHERGRYKPIEADKPLPNDNWPYNGHPNTPYDPQFGVKNPKHERHIFIRRDQYICDIDSQLQIVAMARRSKDGVEDDRMTSATTQFQPMFLRWIDTHIGQAKVKMQSFVLEKFKDTTMNSIVDNEEVDIELLMPDWWDGTVFEQLKNAVLTIETSFHKHIAREEQLLLDYTFAITQLGIFLCGQKNLTDSVSQSLIVLHQCFQILFYFALFPANSFQDIPFLSSLCHFLSL